MTSREIVWDTVDVGVTVEVEVTVDVEVVWARVVVDPVIPAHEHAEEYLTVPEQL